MKFRTKFELKEQNGKEKIIRKFLWLPLYFDGDKTIRWLETADIVYQVKPLDVSYGIIKGYDWEKTRFAEEADYEIMEVEKTYESFEDMMVNRIRNPLLWLVLDLLAIPSILLNAKAGLIFFVFIKLLQFIVLPASLFCKKTY